MDEIVQHLQQEEGELMCGVAQTVARRLAVRQAQVRISSRHPRGGPALYRAEAMRRSRVIYTIFKYYMYARLIENK